MDEQGISISESVLLSQSGIDGDEKESFAGHIQDLESIKSHTPDIQDISAIEPVQQSSFDITVESFDEPSTIFHDVEDTSALAEEEKMDLRLYSRELNRDNLTLREALEMFISSTNAIRQIRTESKKSDESTIFKDLIQVLDTYRPPVTDSSELASLADRFQAYQQVDDEFLRSFSAGRLDLSRKMSQKILMFLDAASEAPREKIRIYLELCVLYLQFQGLLEAFIGANEVSDSIFGEEG